MSEIREWFRDYKTWEGKAQNHFEWDEAVLDQERTLELVMEYHQQYRSLFTGEAQEAAQGYWLGTANEHK